MEDYCTFEQSVALKELGFDWKTYCAYDKIYKDDRPWELRNYHISQDHNIAQYSASAPTLAQAAKWIRKKGLFIHIYLHLDACWRFELQDVNYIDKYIYDPEAGLWWETYEQALLAGIDKALELLKEVNK